MWSLSFISSCDCVIGIDNPIKKKRKVFSPLKASVGPSEGFYGQSLEFLIPSIKSKYRIRDFRQDWVKTIADRGLEKTQDKVEMDKCDGKFGPHLVMAMPTAQQMSRIDQQVPPSVGYAP